MCLKHSNQKCVICWRQINLISLIDRILLVKNKILVSKELKAILRLSLSMSTWILKFPTITVLSNFISNSHKKSLHTCQVDDIKWQKGVLFGFSFFERIKEVECQAFKRTTLISGNLGFTVSMAATPIPLPFWWALWKFIWQGGVDSFQVWAAGVWGLSDLWVV